MHLQSLYNIPSDLKHISESVLLDFFLVALALESLQRLSAVALLSFKLLLEDLDGLIECFNGSAFHLQLLCGKRQRV